jgi:hypothetical protein
MKQQREDSELLVEGFAHIFRFFTSSQVIAAYLVSIPAS